MNLDGVAELGSRTDELDSAARKRKRKRKCTVSPEKTAKVCSARTAANLAAQKFAERQDSRVWQDVVGAAEEQYASAAAAAAKGTMAYNTADDIAALALAASDAGVVSQPAPRARSRSAPQRTAALRSTVQPACEALHLSNLCCKSSSCVPCQREVAPVPGSFCVRGRTEHGRSLTAARSLGRGVCIAELYGAPFSADDPRAYTHAGFAVQVTGGVRVIPHDSCAARYANHSENNPALRAEVWWAPASADLYLPRILLTTRRTVCEGESLTFKYET